jgi:hypothetical protein
MALLDHASEYAKVMEGVKYGHAVYHPPPLAKLKVGDYGFFDKEGDWHKLGSIDVSSPGYPEVEPTQPFQVDVLFSSGVSNETLKTKAS